MTRTRRQTLLALAAAAGALALPAAALAHPLGNFTINHWSEVRVGPASVVVDHVLDLAEIPTFSAFRAVDVDGDGSASDAERAVAAGARCAEQAAGLSLVVAGAAVPLAVAGAAVSFPSGQGAPTMRLVCRLEVGVANVTGDVTFTDGTFAGRVGWREIVVLGDGMTVSGPVGSTGLSARLTAYPSGLLAQAPAVSSVAFSVAPGGPALPPLVQPELSGAAASPVMEAPAAVPGGIAELGGDLAGLFQADELTWPIVLVSLLAAAGLGALHALSPGHGKTVMAAYLVGSRGTARQALGLGTTVTVSHTLGVLALGAVSLSASAIVAPERLYPILGVVSGAIVVVIAGWLLLGIVRGRRAMRAATAAHAHSHQHAPDHAHAGGHDHAHHIAHAHAPARAHAHDDTGTPDPEGWHAHGGIRHTHLPPAGQPLRWRALFALGLAGGMVPSVSAIILLLGSIAAGRPAYGIALTIAFGAGMAVVLMGIGLTLVYARGLLERLPSRSRGRTLGRFVPAGSAAVMLAAGVVITAQAALTLR